ncbi:MAG TPA: undecaprenyl-diphosphate phosphatase [Deltaproteobacteria bacterium]|nr:undecaprenyl-diphosphate phosphatase [Deltaproteobacteria bacterium]
MDTTQAVILALIQGLTEFLPVSSSAHLILLPKLTGRPDQGLAFDVALNTATWLAVVIYFRAELRSLLSGAFRSARTGSLTKEGRTALLIAAATAPVAAAGLAGHDFIETHLRSVHVIAWSSIVWGMVLWAADRHPGASDAEEIGWKAAMVVGAAQALALIPGTSRSGITITAGLFMGLSRVGAARFSFLLAVVVGAMAGGLEGLKLVEAGWDTPWAAVATGFAVAFATAYLTIHLFLEALSRISMTPFVAYRVLLGILLLVLL